MADAPASRYLAFRLTLQPLYDLNLQQLDVTHLVRSWRVVTRHVNQADPSAPLVQARKLCFEAPDRLMLHTDDFSTMADRALPVPDAAELVTEATATGEVPVHVGTWSLERDPLLSRPYLQLQLSTGASRALITRMRFAKEGSDCDMTLYFQTGIEVQLECA